MEKKMSGNKFVGYFSLVCALIVTLTGIYFNSFQPVVIFLVGFGMFKLMEDKTA